MYDLPASPNALKAIVLSQTSVYDLLASPNALKAIVQQLLPLGIFQSTPYWPFDQRPQSLIDTVYPMLVAVNIPCVETIAHSVLPRRTLQFSHATALLTRSVDNYTDRRIHRQPSRHTRNTCGTVAGCKKFHICRLRRARMVPCASEARAATKQFTHSRSTSVDRVYISIHDSRKRQIIQVLRVGYWLFQVVE